MSEVRGMVSRGIGAEVKRFLAAFVKQRREKALGGRFPVPAAVTEIIAEPPSSPLRGR